jgi:hypothetical protein
MELSLVFGRISGSKMPPQKHFPPVIFYFESKGGFGGGYLELGRGAREMESPVA